MKWIFDGFAGFFSFLPQCTLITSCLLKWPAYFCLLKSIGSREGNCSVKNDPNSCIYRQ